MAASTAGLVISEKVTLHWNWGGRGVVWLGEEEARGPQDGPIRRRKHGYILTTDQSGVGSVGIFSSQHRLKTANRGVPYVKGLQGFRWVITGYQRQPCSRVPGYRLRALGLGREAGDLDR
eukprot:3982214-Pyramimonas_sp.AAC.1